MVIILDISSCYQTRHSLTISLLCVNAGINVSEYFFTICVGILFNSQLMVSSFDITFLTSDSDTAGKLLNSNIVSIIEGSYSSH